MYRTDIVQSIYAFDYTTTCHLAQRNHKLSTSFVALNEKTLLIAIFNPSQLIGTRQKDKRIICKRYGRSTN